MSSRPPAMRPTALLALLLLAPGVRTAAGQDATPIPEFAGERIYVREVPDRYRALESRIRQLEAASPQTYYVVVVRSSGVGTHATRDYIDRLYDSWRRDAASRSLTLDPERSVIVVVAIENRQVAVHAGSELRERFGLTGGEIDAELVRPAFLPLARRGDYPEALDALLTATHNRVAQMDSRTTRVEPRAAPAARRAEAEGAPTATSGSPVGAGPSSARGGADAFWAVGGSVLAIALILGGLLWIGRRRAQRNVDGKIKAYRSKAVDMMDRLDALKDRLKRLPAEDPDFKEPMTGETLAYYQQAQERLGKLWDRWLEIMERIDKARALSVKDRALGTEKLKEAEKLVSNPKVFDEVEAEAKECSAAMDRLNAAHEEATAAAKLVVERRAAVRSKLEDVDRAGLPAGPYRPEAERVNRRAIESEQVLTPDPLGARAGFGEAEAWARALEERAGAVLSRLEEARKLAADLDALAATVAGHRRAGLRLDERGGDPDPSEAEARRTLAGADEAIRAGDPATAAERLAAARSLLERGRQAVEAVLAARSLCAREADERPRATRSLRDGLGPAEAAEAELRRKFAPRSWQAVDGNLARARKLIDTFDRKAEEAARAADPGTQEYLLGARLYGELASQQQAALQSLESIAAQLQGLKAVRQQCERLRHDLEEARRGTARFFSQNAQVVGSMARRSLESADEAGQRLVGELDADRPDWPSIHQALTRLIEEYAIARSQAEADVETYRQLTREYELARKEADRVGEFLSSHEEDRMAANQHHRSAVDSLDRVERESTGPEGEWARLLEQVRGAAADLALAERLAREDIRLARQAEAEMGEAHRAIRQARTYFSLGVTINTSGAEADLAGADELYRRREYEQAIRTAGAAIQQVREAHNIAAQQAFLRQMQVQAEQRRRAAQTSGGSFAAGALIGGAAAAAASALGGSTASAAEMPGGEDDGTASASWASEPSETSW